MPDKILNVNIIPSKEDVKKSYLFITSRDRLGEFVSFQNGVLTLNTIARNTNTISKK